MKVKLKAKIKEKNIEEIPISTEFIKLDAFLKFSNAAETGGMAKALVEDGEVKVNGQTCLTRGKKLRPGDTVEVMGSIFKVTAEEKCTSTP